MSVKDKISVPGPINPSILQRETHTHNMCCRCTQTSGKHHSALRCAAEEGSCQRHIGQRGEPHEKSGSCEAGRSLGHFEHRHSGQLERAQNPAGRQANRQRTIGVKESFNAHIRGFHSSQWCFRSEWDQDMADTAFS
jgi:hypothetical protein